MPRVCFSKLEYLILNQDFPLLCGSSQCTTFPIMLFGAAFVAQRGLELGRTDTLICYLGAFVGWIIVALEMRLKTIQIRLAGMDDQLNALGGKDDPVRGPDDNLILELNDW